MQMDFSQLQQYISTLAPANYPWLWQVFVIIFITLLANYLSTFLFNRIERQLQKTANLWDDALVDAARKPLGFLIWLIGFSWALDIVRESSEAQIFDAVGPVREVLVVVLVSWFVARLIRRFETRLLSAVPDHEKLDETTVHAIGKLLRATLFITAGLVIMQTLGYSISGVLAFGGVGGIAVGFAAKDLLSNFFGGLTIYLDRPFKVGDWIRSPEKEIEGVVEHIGWRQTCIRTFDKRPLYVPNSTFTQISVENPSRMLNRRIYETIGVRYDDAAQIEHVITQVKTMLREHEAIDQNQTMIVNFNSFGASSLDFFIYTFTKTTDWIEYHQIKQDVLLKVLNIILELGADVAYPTSTLKIPEPVQLLRADQADQTVQQD
jgi:MscS family membrane protein